MTQIHSDTLYKYVPRDPVFEEGGRWFFYDELWFDTIGPYHTEQEARRDLARYGLYLNGELPEQKIMDAGDAVFQYTTELCTTLGIDPHFMGHDPDGLWYFITTNYYRIHGPYDSKEDAQWKHGEYELGVIKEDGM